MKPYLFIKQILDYLGAIGLTILLSPVLVILVLVIKLDSKGPVFFRQTRIGINDKPFEILKYRTMRIDAPKDMPTHLFSNPEAFITKSGKFLRKSSLDELPQLFNILKGQMSFIGPRPALWNQYDLIHARQICGANRIKPGITGWAQVNGRDELPIDIKAELDGYYADHVCLLLDFKTLVKTFISVLTSKGVTEGGKKGDSK